ncbi:unnamed protein product [Parnassius apollo]|uniref:(apollo) hypothetical protein n=1 Tax=Parnassius apollo TaxID=110799 RepID=A0A8S3XZQ5_PARAO|nr:unnamed protein product [Parnassius apollo]
MDQSYSESDLSMSPSQILERLQVLRQLQLLQRGKLQKQQLQYQDCSEISSNITEIVSHFSNSTSYNTFRSLLHTHQDSSNETSPRWNTSNSTRNVVERDLVDGVSVLNLSQESEFILNSPTSMQSKILSESESGNLNLTSHNSKEKSTNKQIALDEMPILSPKKNFEAMVIENLQNEDNVNRNECKQNKNVLIQNGKKPYLKKGEGMSRFGLQKKDLVIQHTKSLPWHQKKLQTKTAQKEAKKFDKPKTTAKKVEVQIIVSKPSSPNNKNVNSNIKEMEKSVKVLEESNKKGTIQLNKFCISGKPLIEQLDQKIINLPKGKHPLQINNGKTWAAVLTKEQNDFLQQLKQSDYYKNFDSPAKSVISDISCDDNINKMRQEKETAEQNMFDLLESKVARESFNIENSFINRFLQRKKFEYSGESTPLVMQRCLSKNPDLLHIKPNLPDEGSGNDPKMSQSECTECVETCSSISSCCSCITVEPASSSCACYREEKQSKNEQKDKINSNESNEDKEAIVTGVKNKKDKKCHNGNTPDDTDTMKANMAEMNAKLIATSELLKDRLSELEDEIETFRKENANLTKMREEIDLERQKFFEEKISFEQKFNEEKILSEYYLAEEKEKITKQKQLYERYVRDMRGRLNKKDKDEVINLKKEIKDLKEEIRVKDVKSTSTIARLRNQLKIMEKEKKSLEDEVEKLKKENRRIQHSNEVTRRLTNLKYLEQINNKLSNMVSKDSRSEINLDPNIKYKGYEIERQSRSRRIQSQNKGIRPRAKSVPNLNVTSRYAKYFSQKDTISEAERNKTLNVDVKCNSPSHYIEDQINYKDSNIENTGTNSDKSVTDSEDENNLEKIYTERFQNSSPKSRRSTLSNSSENSNHIDTSSYFIRKSSSSQDSSGSHYSKCNESNFVTSKVSNSNGNQRSLRNSPIGYSNSDNFSKSPTLTSNPSSNQRLSTVVNKEQYQDSRMVVTPEPYASNSSLSKTNLNPTEIRKPDGSRELRFPNGNVKFISANGKYSKFVYYNGDVKENFYNEGRIKYFYAETKTFHTTHADGLEVLEFSDGQVEKRYKDGSSEIRLPNGSVRYYDPKNEHVREEWRFPDGAALTISANGEKRIVFSNGQVEVHANDHKRREFPDGTVKLIYNDGTAETRYASGRIRIKDKHGKLIMDSAPS